MPKSTGTFRAVDQSGKRMFGATALVAFGFSFEERAIFQAMLSGNGLAHVPLVFATDRQCACSLGELTRTASQTPSAGEEQGDGPRAVVCSGLLHAELHALMKGYRGAGLPRPLWASLTKVSQHWPAARLLGELTRERTELKQAVMRRQETSSESGG